MLKCDTNPRFSVQRGSAHRRRTNFVTLPLPEILGPLWGASEFVLVLARRSKSDATSKDRHSLGLIWLVVLSAILLGGLLLNALAGLWWADPISGLIMVPIIVKEGLGGLRGDTCCH